LRGLRTLIIMLVVAGFFCVALPQLLTSGLNIPPAALPVIQLPAERLSAEPLLDFPGEYSDIYLTNTLIATAIADVILIALALLATRKVREVPQGLQNTVEGLLEVLLGFCEQVAERKARMIFPLMATIFLLLLVANWMELIPGVDSIGILHHAEAGVKGHAAREVANNVYILDVDPQNRAGIEAEEGGHEEEGEHEGGHGEDLYVVTPFVRAAATDLNLTLGLAIASVIAIQYYGIRALGLGYFTKFLNISAMDTAKKGPMGTIDFGVSILELISEFAKIISFAFRLLGNIFAGQVLLFVIAFLIPFALPVVFFGLEVFVGAIQAFVFAMLTLVFVNTAMISHHDEGH